MGRAQSLALIAAATLALALAACGEPANERDTSAAPDTTVAAARSAAATAVVADSTAVKACDVATEAELEAILSLDLDAGRTTNDYAGDSACRWDLAGDPRHGVTISLRRLPDLALYERVPGSEAVAGLGEAAVWNAGPGYGQLALLQGERVLSVNLLLDDARRAQADAIARVALDRI